jgi:hypothetical protein
MIVVIAILGFVVALFVIAGVIDLKARRRGVRYTVGKAAPDANRELNRAELNMRTDMGNSGYGGGGF